jgi:uncharacterized protein YllA (UPF0747 family)
LYHQYDQARHQVLAQLEPAAVRTAFAQGRDAVEQVVDLLTVHMEQVEATLGHSAQASRQRMLHELERLEHKTRKAVERRSREVVERLHHIREQLFPQHTLQERTLGTIAVWARLGPQFAPLLGQTLDQQEGRHCFVEL